jgi:hypothetical protein
LVGRNYCRHCDFKFEIDWETIWDIQDCTHGYVGYYLNDTFISCPKCDKVCTDEEVCPKSTGKVNLTRIDDQPFNKKMAPN